MLWIHQNEASRNNMAQTTTTIVNGDAIRDPPIGTQQWQHLT